MQAKNRESHTNLDKNIMWHLKIMKTLIMSHPLKFLSKDSQKN